jgi:phosphate transport system protein
VRTTFEQRLEGLEAKLLQMGQLVQSQLDRTIEALAGFDTTLADEVIVRDDQIDRTYVEVEQEILRTLALQAPVARDLRLVAGVLHINSHIERMGDLCVNMAKFVRITKDFPPVPEIQSTLVEMGGHAQRMVAEAIT